ncbi:MAG: hypothetical protein WCS77_03390 [Elusimicrobiaceae bacterium]|jgi:PTS system mannose-specific IIA component
MTNIIIVTHGDFGAYLVEAAEMIIGVQKEGVELVPISQRIPVEKASERLSAVIEKFAEDGAIIFTDILGGTPTNISIPKVQGRENMAVISGVNLNMLLSAFSYRGKLSHPELVKKVLADGIKSICDVSGLFAKAQAREKV